MQETFDDWFVNRRLSKLIHSQTDLFISELNLSHAPCLIAPNESMCFPNARAIKHKRQEIPE